MAAGDTLDYVFTLTAMDKKFDVGIDGSDPSLGAALVLDGLTALKYVLIDGHLSLSTNGQNGRSYQVGSISEGAARFPEMGLKSEPDTAYTWYRDERSGGILILPIKLSPDGKGTLTGDRMILL